MLTRTRTPGLIVAALLIAIVLSIALPYKSEGQLGTGHDEPAAADSGLYALAQGRVVRSDSPDQPEPMSSKPDYPARSITPLALTGSISFETDRVGTFDIYAQDADGSSPAVPLVTSPGSDFTPVWSPDGTQMVFASDRDGDFDVYLRTANSKEYNLTQNTAEDFHPSWSPGGDRIIFTSNRGGSYFQIYTMRTDGTDMQQVGVVPNNNAMYPRYSPDGSRIAFMRASITAPLCEWNWDVWLMDTDGGNQQRVTTLWGADLYPDWTPDGTEIVYASCRNFFDFDLYAVNPDTGTESQINSWFLSDEWGAIYSPDAEHIAFNTNVDGNIEIYVGPSAGGAVSNFTQNGADDLAASWASQESPTTYSISGRVADDDNNPIPHVTISDNAGHIDMTGDDGSYILNGLAAGTYILTPSKGEWTFTPPTHTASVPPSATGWDFTGEPRLSISHIEVTQAIQDENNNVPLIAGKPTFVRVYVDCGADCTSLPNVTGWLEVSGPAGGISLAPINGSITAHHPSNGWTGQRGELSRTLNFLVVPTDLVTGTVTFTAMVGGTSESETCTFQAGQKLHIAWTLVGYGPGEIATYADGMVAGAGDSFLRKIYPVGTDDVDYFYQPGFSKVIKAKFSCGLLPLLYCPAKTKYLNALNRFWDRISREGGWRSGSPPDRLYGWIPNAARVSKGLCGIADARWWPYIPVPVLFPRGKGRVAVGADFCDKEGGIIISPSSILAHELGHILNDQELHHTPNRPRAEDPHCFEEPGDHNTDYPDHRGYIGEYGLDVLSGRLLSPESTYDFMSYCSPAWVSPYNYNKLNTGFASSTGAASKPNVLSTATRQLLVSGTVYTPSLTVEFDPFYAITSTVAADASSGGSFCLELRDSGEATLDSRCFELGFVNPESGDPIAEDAFALAIPYPIDTTQIVLTYLGTSIGSVMISDNAPTVTLTYPNGGEVWSGTGTYTVTWTANDLDGDPLYYALSYSIDAGDSWIPVGIDITTIHHVLDVSYLPGGSTIMLRVSASDGVNTTDDASDGTFTVGRKGPQVLILSPEGDVTIRHDALLWLQGYAYDLEDGTLEESALRWISSLDGDLGTGSQVLVTLSQGQHVITLTATDSDDNTATATINVFVGSKVYLPTILKHAVLGPDLVVDSLVATSNAVTVTIKNQGNAPVTDDFWVDVYFNPTETPSLNHPWDTIASRGVVWGVTTPITANGGTLTLTTGDAYYVSEYSSTPPLPVGADVYALVDSINHDTTYGMALESNEDNNLFGPVTSTAGVAGEAAPIGNQGQSPSMEGLPPRR